MHGMVVVLLVEVFRISIEEREPEGLWVRQRGLAGWWSWTLRARQESRRKRQRSRGSLREGQLGVSDTGSEGPESYARVILHWELKEGAEYSEWRWPLKGKRRKLNPLNYASKYENVS